MNANPNVTSPASLDATPKSHRPFLTIDEAAEEIGSCRRFIELRIEDGELKVFRPSARLVRISRIEFDRWVEQFTKAKAVVAA